MSSQQPSVRANTASNPGWDENLVFRALRDSARRELLVALASGGEKAAFELNGGHPSENSDRELRRFERLLKNLAVLVAAGIAEKKVDPRDARKQLYTLSPRIKVTRTADQTIFDFGFAVFRLP